MKSLVRFFVILFTFQAFGQVGSGRLGSFDPSHEDDPHSVVDISANGNGVVSTKISYSDNNGLAFTDISVVNPSTDLNAYLSWNNEVSSLLYDPSELSSGSKWKIIWEKHLVNKLKTPDPRDFGYSWIAMKGAASPISQWSPEVKLLAGTAYNPNNTLSPGHPLFQLPASMSDCLVLTEPSTLAAPDGFYLSVNCARSATVSDTRIPLVKFRRASSGVVLETKGDLLTPYDVLMFRSLYGGILPELNSIASFSATELVEKNGRIYLLATPVDAQSKYLGCTVFEISNIENATIARWGSFPKLVSYVQGRKETFRGACPYSKNSTGSGIVLSQRDGALPFTIENTFLQLP